jgi:hypothetical protein
MLNNKMSRSKGIYRHFEYQVHESKRLRSYTMHACITFTKLELSIIKQLDNLRIVHFVSCKQQITLIISYKCSSGVLSKPTLRIICQPTVSHCRTRAYESKRLCQFTTSFYKSLQLNQCQAFISPNIACIAHLPMM